MRRERRGGSLRARVASASGVATAIAASKCHVAAAAAPNAAALAATVATAAVATATVAIATVTIATVTSVAIPTAAAGTPGGVAAAIATVVACSSV